LLPFALIAASVSTLLAIAALFRSRSNAKRAERLSESYWELRYEIGQLRVRLNRLETAGVPGAAAETPVEEPRPAASTTSFIPLSSLKK